MGKIKATVSNDFRNADQVIRYTDANYCGVLALHFATGISIKECQKILARNGRKAGNGTSLFQLSAALADLGYQVATLRPDDHQLAQYSRSINEEIISKYPSPHHNLKSVTTHHPERFNKVWKELGTCFLFSKNHVSCAVDGELKDWAKGRSRKVTEIWFIKKKEA